MAIDMVPMMEPEFLSAQQPAEHSAKREMFGATIGGKRIHVMPLPYIKARELRKLAEASQNPSQFIVGLNRVYYLSGYLLVQVSYARAGDDIYVYARQAKLTAVEGPDAIRGFFSPLIGEKNLSVSEYEKQRVLANIKSQRQGVNYGVSFEIDASGNGAVLQLTPKDGVVDRHEFSAELNNRGNRFVGREFINLGWRYWGESGVELNARYIKGISEQSEEEVDSDYDAIAVSLSAPTASGIYGVEGSLAEYTRVQEVAGTGGLGCGLFGNPALCNGGSVTVQDVSSDMSSVALMGEQILYARPGTRWTLSERLAFVSDELSDNLQGATLLDEKFAVASIMAKYAYQSTASATRRSVYVKLSKGFGSGGTLDNDTGGFDGAAVEKRQGDFLQIEPGFDFAVGLGKSARFGVNGRGVFSNGVQVPQKQQFTAGGMSNVSAYFPGVIVGDSGVYGKLYLAGVPTRSSGFRLIPEVFLERASAWYEDADNADGDDRMVSDAGVRVLILAGSALQLEFVAARELTSKNIDEQVLDDKEVSFFASAKLLF